MNFNVIANEAKSKLEKGSLGNVFLFETDLHGTAGQISVEEVKKPTGELIKALEVEYGKIAKWYEERAISACGAVQDEWLLAWGYTLGTHEAYKAWEGKLALDKKVSLESGRITPNSGIIPDIQPYQSMIDGSIITSRSKHRNHLKDHGCIEVGNEKMTPKAPEPPKGLRDDIGRAVYQHLS